MSKMLGLGGMVHRGFDDGCGLFGLAQGGETIQRRGCVDGSPSEGLLTLLHPGNG
jgi:hypothetical protein